MPDSWMTDARQILRNVLAEYADADKWIGSPFERIKRISNTKVGDIGQDFIEKLCGKLGFECVFPLDRKGKRARTEAWDIRIEGITFEVKTATEDVHKNFQFNHVRYHRDYDALLCVGIAPDDILFDAWSKAEVTTGKAGHLSNHGQRIVGHVQADQARRPTPVHRRLRGTRHQSGSGDGAMMGAEKSYGYEKKRLRNEIFDFVYELLKIQDVCKYLRKRVWDPKTA